MSIRCRIGVCLSAHSLHVCLSWPRELLLFFRPHVRANVPRVQFGSCERNESASVFARNAGLLGRRTANSVDDISWSTFSSGYTAEVSRPHAKKVTAVADRTFPRNVRAARGLLR